MSHLLRFGVLGAARIAPRALIDPVAKLSGVEVSRVAARDPQRAATFAADHDIAEVSATYAEVIAADDVDIVYNPLPMSLHAEWTIAALRAGKHVLCEKPFASNATEAADMVRVAEEEGRILGEAFHYFYHPLFRRILDEVASGRIGDLVRLEAEFETPVAKPNLRWDYATSGGSLMDLGCYPMHWVRQLAGEEPTV
ncbi:MAG: Gfo/Idh/MocA family oxidoreductase, partial [Actinomycetia bacterium]|nr:Gfo/Idh/MocA family oxidoreductase [Actinomycetes bacterium]